MTLNGCKVLGSAQRRRRGAILQHGSLIRRASRLAEHLPGLTNLVKAELPGDLCEILIKQVAGAIANSHVAGTLTKSEIEAAQQLCAQQRTKIGQQ